MSQTSYSNKFTAALAGQLAYCAPGQSETIDTMVMTADVLAGRFVCKDTTVGKAKLPATTGNVTADGYGFVVRRMAREPAGVDGTTAADYKSGQDVPVLRQGRIWVECESAAAFGGSTFVRFATGTGTKIGATYNAADTATCVAAPGWTFATELAAAGLVMVEKL